MAIPTTAEYRNWLALGQALSLLCNGLRPFVEKQMRALHEKLVAYRFTPCGCVHVPRRKPNPYHDMGACAWACHLERHHCGPRPNWKQTDPAKWTDPQLGYWEIAKLFMPDMGPGAAAVKGPQDADVTGLLNLMTWCTQFTVQKALIGAVRGIRNTNWVHVPNLELSETDKQVAFDAIENLLQDPAFAGEPSVEKALQDVVNLRGVSDVQNLEARVLAEFSEVLHEENEKVKGELEALHRLSSRGAKQRRRLEARLTHMARVMRELQMKCKGGQRQGAAGQVPELLLAGLFSCVNSIPVPRKKDAAMWLSVLFLLCCCRVLDRSSFNDGERLKTCGRNVGEETPFLKDSLVRVAVVSR